ncbi:MAG: hypothetical protein Q7R65_04055 [bacterium]|nr:hypothetical protein [bacterium]
MDTLDKKKRTARNIFVISLLITIAWWSLPFIHTENPSKLLLVFSLILAPLSTLALVGMVISGTVWVTLSKKKTDKTEVSNTSMITNPDQSSEIMYYRRKARVLTAVGIAVILLATFLTVTGTDIASLGVLLLFPPTLFIIVVYPLYVIYLWAKYFVLKSTRNS